MLALIFMFFMIDDKKNPFFFSLVSIFGELYPNVLAILGVIIEFECPLSVNNLDIFYPDCNLPFHLNNFFPNSKNYFQNSKSLNKIAKDEKPVSVTEYMSGQMKMSAQGTEYLQRSSQQCRLLLLALLSTITTR